ncbi:MAG: alpha-D-xyloside xylohydrolase [Acidimicrobiaceae bacterium]|nr:alpha-D-xyloside xylohydrolase [Acidimicrobiaceae bacterium]
MRRPLTEVASWPSVRADGPVDEIVSAGSNVVELASGASVPVWLTEPVDGVCRITVGGPPAASPVLVDGLSDRPWTGPLEGWAAAALAPRSGSGRRADGGWMVSLPLAPEAAVYGGGESFQGPDLRGRRRTLVNVETHGASGYDLSYLNVPFLWSNGWGVLCPSGGPVVADVGATHSETAFVGTEDDVLDLFVLRGEPLDLLRQYHALSGLPGRFPEWALGLWTSRCSYLSEAEIAEVLDGYEAADCPVDVVHVDAWVAGNVIEDLACNWTVDRTRFPEGWVQRLGERGVRVSLWHNPYVVKGSERAAELESLGLLVPGAVTADKDDRLIIDFTNPAAVEWWHERVRETVASEGIHAFKPDFAEELPEGATLFDGRPSRAARNEYSLLYQRATHDAMGGDEVALFCRSGTTGAQRYPCHWVGDTPSTWPGLVTALRACLSLSLSGFAFVSHDVGGFWTGGSQAWVEEAFKVMDNRDVPADVEPELFGRWAQWGALSPVLRFHGTGRREPWAYPDPWGSAAVAACRLRNDVLRPYLAKAAAQASSEGVPMMRPPALTHPEARVDSLQFLLGDDVLVAPLLAPGGTRTFWVPPGRWSPLLGLTAVEGPGWITVECGPEQFPAWVRD